MRAERITAVSTWFQPPGQDSGAALADDAILRATMGRS